MDLEAEEESQEVARAVAEAVAGAEEALKRGKIDGANKPNHANDRGVKCGDATSGQKREERKNFYYKKLAATTIHRSASEQGTGALMAGYSCTCSVAAATLQRLRRHIARSAALEQGQTVAWMTDGQTPWARTKQDAFGCKNITTQTKGETQWPKPHGKGPMPMRDLREEACRASGFVSRQYTKRVSTRQTPIMTHLTGIPQPRREQNRVLRRRELRGDCGLHQEHEKGGRQHISYFCIAVLA
jgi:hypothetical protein